MSNLALKQLLFKHQFSLVINCHRTIRSPMHPNPKRNFEEKNKVYLQAHKDKRLGLAERADMPNQFKLREKPAEKRILTNERKLVDLKYAKPPYHNYDETTDLAHRSTWFDPLFNPHLHDGRGRVNPDEEPFNAIYNDSNSELSSEYTETRDITTPELWEYVERLARIKLAPMPRRRKAGEPIQKMPSGFVPPPENPPDLPYFVPRTRNYLLPVYYHIDSDPEKCYTYILNVSGDLWKLEQDLRSHLESLSYNKRRILTSVSEPDEKVLFRGKHLHQVADWLHQQGF